MNFCVRYSCNFIVLTFAAFLFVAFALNSCPKSKVFITNKFTYFSISFFVTGSFIMFMWCWLYASFTDPGYIENDLERKGLLRQIRQGEIPIGMQGLKICPKCNLPQPFRCYHCEECERCVLRHDHHCGVIGNCVGDKNFKAFILSFFYSFLFGISSSIVGGICFFNQTTDIISLLVFLYGILLGLLLLGFGVAFFMGGFSAMSYKPTKKVTKTES